MLAKRIPDRLNAIKLEIVRIDKRRSYEPWRLTFLTDLVEAVERNAEQLRRPWEETDCRCRPGLPEISWNCSCGFDTAALREKTLGVFMRMPYVT